MAIDLEALGESGSGYHTLGTCGPSLDWPERGVYFFFESTEMRSDSGIGPRVVRVGTHALNPGGKKSLWQRLAEHRGAVGSGGGRHRSSIFRLLVGTAIGPSSGPASWGLKRGALEGYLSQQGLTPAELQALELPTEKAVSEHVRAMPFLVVNVDDAPGPTSLRGVIERNSIALLSNYDRDQLDSPSASWLGHRTNHLRVQRSGLWNNKHVDEDHDPDYLTHLEAAVRQTYALGGGR